jgi:hypothetical protein
MRNKRWRRKPPPAPESSFGKSPTHNPPPGPSAGRCFFVAAPWRRFVTAMPMFPKQGGVKNSRPYCRAAKRRVCERMRFPGTPSPSLASRSSSAIPFPRRAAARRFRRCRQWQFFRSPFASAKRRVRERMRFPGTPSPSLASRSSSAILSPRRAGARRSRGSPYRPPRRCRTWRSASSSFWRFSS